MCRKLNMNSCFRALTTTLFLLALTACGGGGTIERDPGTGGGGGNTPTLSITMSIADSSGQSSNNLSATTPLTITATVSDSTGALIADELVTFTFSQAGLATFDNDTGTGLTNANGVATIDILVGESSGDGLVIATVDTDVTQQVGFSSTGNAQTGTVPASLEFFANSIQLASSGSDEIELIAVVKNEQNILLEGVDVSFSANSGAEIQITQGTTAEDGTARAILTTRTNFENRTITATASASIFSETLDIDVVGTAITISGSSSVVLANTTSITIKLADSDGKGIANQMVNVSSLNGQLSNTTPTTNSQGQVTIDYTATASGNDTITASALNAQGSLNLVVQEDEFAFVTLPQEEVALGVDTAITVEWKKEGVSFQGGDVTFSASRGVIATPNTVTDANGLASFTIQSDNAGLATVTAEGVDGDGDIVSATATVEFIAIVADTIIVDASPDLIGPEGQTTTITAVVRDPTGNLVKGKVVNFRLDDISGGTIFPGTATTDSNGIASTVYTSTAPSSKDAVIVHAEVADDVAITDFTTLTVGNRAFDISLGTGRSIETPDESTYAKEFSVFVSDANGAPVKNADLTASQTPVRFADGGGYYKGYWEWDPVAEVWFTVETIFCPNEDINGNGILDAGEDTNGNGELTPGIIGTISFEDGSTTDENGQAKVKVRYPKAFGGWTEVDISLYGQSEGSEAVETQEFFLTVAAADVIVEASSPPPNPFGLVADCSTTQ